MKVEKEKVDAILAMLLVSHHHFPETREVHAVLYTPPDADVFGGGFVFGRGHSSCLDDETFVLEKGIEIATRNARVDAENRIWEYLGLFNVFNKSVVSRLVYDKSVKTTVTIED